MKYHKKQGGIFYFFSYFVGVFYPLSNGGNIVCDIQITPGSVTNGLTIL